MVAVVAAPTISSTEIITAFQQASGLRSRQGPTTAAPAAVINAIVDALQQLKVRDITLPATPLSVWPAIEEAKAHSSIHPMPAVSAK
jgi:CO/xanthine dehydrogenase Mo-binding subunit